MKKNIKRLCYLTFLLVSFTHSTSQGNTSTPTALTNAQKQSCGCDHTISTYNWSVDGNDIDNNKLAVQPGETICLDASVSYANMTWKNINGAQGNPITIKNCGGQAYINSHNSRTPNIGYGWRFKNSQFFKISGDGDPQHPYGVKVSTPGGFYITMESFTTNFEISNVEVAGIIPVTPTSSSGFAGIGIKTKPRCDGSSDRGTWTMRDVKIHDNYIHGVGGEGLYIGYGFYDGRVESYCDTVGHDELRRSHAIHGLRVFNNRVDAVGYDGIQVKNADTDARIYNNVITNYGLKQNGNHDEGLLVGDGSEALIYNNWIENGAGVKKGNGMQLNAFGNTKVFNNVVINVGPDATQNLSNKKHSIYINNNSPYISNRTGVFEVYNNTFVGAQNNGIAAYTPQDLVIKNNIFTGYVAPSAINFTNSLTNVGNIFEPSLSNVGFINPSNNDFHLQSTSVAVGAGVNTPANSDHDGLLRVDNVFDAGAYEFGGVPAAGTPPQLTIVTPSANIQLSSHSAHVELRSVFIEVDLVDPDNIVQKVEYFLNGQKIGTDTLPRTLEHHIGGQRLIIGNNEFYALSTDSMGQTTESQHITITVTQ